ncbi:hypothetical protein CLOM_g14689 [Closterium sp. NIES-68]|nr:hypothetical protein CLOM_g14689 [Closterium sp. NIES-68]
MQGGAAHKLAACRHASTSGSSSSGSSSGGGSSSSSSSSGSRCCWQLPPLAVFLQCFRSLPGSRQLLTFESTQKSPGSRQLFVPSNFPPLSSLPPLPPPSQASVNAQGIHGCSGRRSSEAEKQSSRVAAKQRRGCSRCSSSSISISSSWAVRGQAGRGVCEAEAR